MFYALGVAETEDSIGAIYDHAINPTVIPAAISRKNKTFASMTFSFYSFTLVARAGMMDGTNCATSSAVKAPKKPIAAI
jgi:hypothetical protein